MNKSVISNPAFTSLSHPSSKPGFNLVTTTNTFTSIFDPKSLDQHEEEKIHTFLSENLEFKDVSKEEDYVRLDRDFQQLKSLMSEIKAIQKQSIVLLGERIHKVRLIFKSYREGTFTKWLKIAFHSKQTGYNILAYYEFFKSLPADLQDVFKRLPQKAAYTLASRDGTLEEKVTVLRDLDLIGSENLLLEIRERLPIATEDRRKTKGTEALLLRFIFKNIQTLSSIKETLSEESKEGLRAVRLLIDEILKLTH